MPTNTDAAQKKAITLAIETAVALKKGGMDRLKAMQAVANIIENTIAGDSVSEVFAKCESAYDFEVTEKSSLSDQIWKWVCDTGVTGSVTVTVQDCDRELGIVTSRDKANRRQVFKRLRENGIIEPFGNKVGYYRIVSHELEEIEFTKPSDVDSVELVFPMGIQTRFEIDPGSVIVVSGESNAGKTAFMLNLARLNMGRLPVTYFGSSAESNSRTLRKRIKAFGDDLMEWAPMRAVKRGSDFGDVIDPNGLNLIDYLELTGAAGKEFYLVGEEMSRIHEALQGGVAVVGLQHKPGSEMAIGGHYSVHKATLALSLHRGKENKPHTLRFIKIKYPLDSFIGDPYFPVNFRLGGGCVFKEVVHENYGPTRDPHYG